MLIRPTPPCVVVGVDGSKAARGAALWAVDEAVSRDIPLRLVYAIDETSVVYPGDAARKFATAEIAVRDVVMAVQATDLPVKVEVQIIQGPPLPSLIQISRSAAMVCVGSIGLRHLQPGGAGSTATGLAKTAQCPVAIIRRESAGLRQGCIVVHVHDSPEDGVAIECALEEARLRRVSLRVLGCWKPPSDRPANHGSIVHGCRHLSAQLDRRLQEWSRRYPDVQVESLVVHTGIVDYLATNGHTVQMLVVNARNHHDVEELSGQIGIAALHQTDCSILVVNRPPA